VKRSALLFAALIGVASVADAAMADNALRPEKIPAKARQLANRGRVYHDAGDYAAAVAAFKEAYVLAPSPGLLFNIAQAYRLAGNCDEAAWMYRRFLDTNPNGPNKALAEQHLTVVEKCGTGGLRTVVIPPKVVAKVPDPKSVGKVDASASLGASGKSHASLSTSFDREDHKARTYKRVGIGLTVGAGAAFVGAAVFALDARDAQNTVEELYRQGGKWSDVKDVDARGKRSATLATALGIGGGVAVVSGAVLYGLGHRYEKAQHVAVVPTSDGAQVSLSWGF
jgi:tetratricopeptide (TPR) repeat protein